MVNVTVTKRDDPEFALALSYAPAGSRAALAALFALDAALGQVLRTTREPMVGQIRLAWWREALARLDVAPPPGEPVLRDIAAAVLPHGVTGAVLARMVDGWENLLREPLDIFAIQRHAVLRGALLFEAGARVCGAHDRRIEMVGRGWALADIAANVADMELARKAQGMADIRIPRFTGLGSFRHPWTSSARSLSALGLIARMNSEGRTGPTRVLRLGWHRLTGR